ncbi:4517_t:CDS:2, partial [Dentiscutata heterogama]
KAWTPLQKWTGDEKDNYQKSTEMNHVAKRPTLNVISNVEQLNTRQQPIIIHPLKWVPNNIYPGKLLNKILPKNDESKISANTPCENTSKASLKLECNVIESFTIRDNLTLKAVQEKEEILDVDVVLEPKALLVAMKMELETRIDKPLNMTIEIGLKKDESEVSAKKPEMDYAKNPIRKS